MAVPALKTSDLTPYLELQRLERQQAIQNWVLGKAFGLPISLLESHFVAELAGDPNITATQFSQIVDLDGLSVFRMIRGLIDRGYISQAKSKEDGRAKQYSFTKKGRILLADYDKRSSKNFARMFDRLSPSEQPEFMRYMSVLADGLATKRLSYRKTMHPIHPIVGGITRGRGMLGNKLFASHGLTHLGWHALFEINTSAAPPTAADVSRRLAAPSNTLSYVLTQLEQEKLITRRSDKLDRRRNLLSLTPAGRRFIDKVEFQGAHQFKDALSSLSSDEIMRFFELAEKYIGVGKKNLVIQESLNVVRLVNKEEKHLARIFLMENLVRRGTHRLAEAILLDDDSVCFALKMGDHFKGVVEFINQGDLWELCHVVAAPEIELTDVYKQFIHTALTEAFETCGTSEIVSRLNWYLDESKIFPSSKVTGESVVINPEDL